MGSRRGRGKTPVSRPQYFDPNMEGRLKQSDAQYVRDSRRRRTNTAARTWIIRLGVLAALAIAVKLWGADVVHYIKFRSTMTAYETEQGAKGVKSNIDERTGANFDTNP